SQAATWRSQTEETSTTDRGSPSCHRPWKSQLSQTVEVPAVTDRGSPSCHRPWKSQLSQTVEVPAVTDRGSPSCHRPVEVPAVTANRESQLSHRPWKSQLNILITQTTRQAKWCHRQLNCLDRGSTEI
ncbi:hypothetical protein LSAT2_005245, partial [Lamellibrachia satsuma]